MKNRLQFKKWEIALIALGAALLLSSSLVYFTDFSLHKYFFDIQDDQGHELFGKLSEKSGFIRKKSSNSMKFETIQKDAPLYNQDTVATGADSKGTIEMEDGSQIELGPSTMVRLNLASKFSLAGVSRSVSVRVFSGSVTGETKKRSIQIRSDEGVTQIKKNDRVVVKAPPPKVVPVTPKPTPLASATPSATPSPTPTPIASPTPSPSPTPTLAENPNLHVQLLAPKAGSVMNPEASPDGFQKRMTFKWKLKPKNSSSIFVLTQLIEKEAHKVVERIVNPKNGVTSISLILKQPGLYRWEVKGPNREEMVDEENTSKFTVSPEVPIIQPLVPLIGGIAANSNRYQGSLISDFDITVRWKAVPDIEEYTVQLLNSPNSTRPIAETQVKKTKLKLDQEQINSSSGRVYYRVRAPMPNGFIAVSEPKPLIFHFLPPIPVTPQDGAVISASALASNNRSFLMTWQKTNFTDLYEFELAIDSQFRNVMIKKKVPENFLLVKSPKPGKYFWRLKSVSKEFTSPFSKPFVLVVSH